ncbi:MAG: hypothetical protein OXF28_02410, partial [Thaumarchaeota archaeon]|nr:hypothetical protein [Nitrososphaerota archaeon]MCY3975970.1 hypothetical protein [Nitrososphaerota archaeon]
PAARLKTTKPAARLKTTKSSVTYIDKSIKHDDHEFSKLMQEMRVILESNISDGISKNDLCKKLQINNNEFLMLISELENTKTIKKVRKNGKLLYKILIKSSFIDTSTIENAPCLICPVEQQCSLDGEVTPKTCKLIEEWVIKDIN